MQIRMTEYEARKLLAENLSNSLKFGVDEIHPHDIIIEQSFVESGTNALREKKITLMKMLREFAEDLSNPQSVIKMRPEGGVGLADTKHWIEKYFGWTE